MSHEIGLSELITKIKEDLERTNKKSPAFFVEKVELDLQVTVYKGGEAELQGQGEADLKINVLSVDLLKLGGVEASGKATGKLNREDVHKIKVTLTPAIGLSEEIWKRLESDLKEEIKDGTRKVLLHNDSSNKRI
ncbi:MAG: trypco2 family protein [Xenococcaceae cyanobacterium]